ncbi:adapter complex 1 gamma subunit [Cryptosporidium sp. chipmunk genotype I]|uniref:adapter complex 1 gamma subunit n=1 Tax=Cryptosporidium sp. chipmunk genotype I TaxID=1280935 RepID=UPI00351A3EE3|nr:adapter complex 1 gamma subunit [Cryptosporidium sp. chipmunk genotype I]
MSIKLRELIRQVRSCKTAAEERSIISKECAHIRALFKEDENQYRQRNIAKLLFIHMLGYPSQFGQVECLKLIASNKFCEKRIGYLAICQLLDEDSEILLLATNSIKNDLNHSNQYINGLALSAIANTAPKEMCRAVFREVSELLLVGNPFIKKRALLASVHIIRVLEDAEIESFINCIPSLLEDKHHGVLLGTCHMINSIIQYHPENIEALGPFVPLLVKILNTISMAGYLNSMEYDNGGVTDQFLQVHILITIGDLRTVIADDIKENICAALAQLLTNTDNSRNGGNSILYESVRTIIKLLPYINEDGLYMLAVNTVTKFLQNTDLNIRFVALGLLEHMKEFPNNSNTCSITSNINENLSGNNENGLNNETAHAGLAPHHALILDCLKDSDSSIKLRALKVLFSVINERNIKIFVKDLLNALLISTENGEMDFSIELATGMCMAIRKCKHLSPQWYIDTYIKLFCLAGNIIKEEERDYFISYLSSLSDSSIHSYTVKKLYLSLLSRNDQILLIQVTLWAIGEYSQYLFTNNSGISSFEDQKSIDSSEIDISEESVISLIENILISNTREMSSSNYSLSSSGVNNLYIDYSHPTKGVGAYISINSIETTINFALIALAKASVRLKTQKNRILKLIQSQASSPLVETQQRALEYIQILNSNWDSNRNQILNPIPVFDLSNLHSNETRSNSYNNFNAYNSPKNIKNENIDKNPNNNNLVTDLLDLDSNINEVTANTNTNNINTSRAESANGNILDLFDNLTTNNTKTNPNTSNTNDFMAPASANATALTATTNHSGSNNYLLNFNDDKHAETIKSSPFEDLIDFNKLNLSSSHSSSAPNDNFNSVETIKIYENKDIRITFDISKNKFNQKETNFTAKYFNISGIDISNFKLEIAVPKYLNIHLETASSSHLPSNNFNYPAKQEIKITKNGDHNSQILMKLRINYLINNNQVTEYSNVNNIPNKY